MSDDEEEEAVFSDEGEEGSEEGSEGESEPEEPAGEFYQEPGDGDGSDLEGFIVPDGDMEGDEESGEESGSASDSERDGSVSEEEEVQRGIYNNWQTMRAMYEEGSLEDEPGGYYLHHQLHAKGWTRDRSEWSEAEQDALWRHVLAKTSAPGWGDQWGVRALEVEHHGSMERIVERFKYGTEFEDEYEEAQTGNYKDAFFRVMEEVFEQEPYQAPPDINEAGEMVLPEPCFLDFENEYCSEKPPGYDRGVRRGQHRHGPLWCLCCQCTKKKLYKVMIARHTLSNILVVTGGDCSKKMLRDFDLDYRAQAHGEAVHDLLRLR